MDELRFLIFITHLLIIAFALMICAFAFRKGFFMTVLALTTFILFDSIGILYLMYWPAYLPYIGGVWYSPLRDSETVLVRQIIAHWIVFSIGISLTLILLEVKKGLVLPNTFLISRIPKIYVVLSSLFLFGIGIYFYYKYFFIGPGLEILLTTRLKFSSTIEAVAERMLASRKVKVGQGAFGSYLASVVFFPLGVFIWRYHKLPLSNILFSFFGLLSLIYAVQTRQKAPSIITILQYVLIFYFTKYGKYSFEKLKSQQMKRFLFNIIIIGAILSSLAYIINFGQGLLAAVSSTFSRIFLVPANAESFWFFAIPDYLSYTQDFSFLHTNMERIRNVAYAATGDIFSANASFVAVGWSALGFIGVFLAAFALFGSLFLIDLLALRIDPIARYGLYSLSIPAFFIMVSGSVGDFYSKGVAATLLGVILFTIFGYFYSRLRKNTPN